MDRDGAQADVAAAVAIAERTGGTPTLLRCRLLQCELNAGAPGTGPRARALEVDARSAGMLGVADAAGRLAEAAVPRR